MPYHMILHKGKSILIVDYRSCKTEEDMIKLLHDVGKVYDKAITQISVLLDFRDVNITKGYLDESKRVGKEYAHKRKKVAALGTKGLQKIALNAYNLIAKDKIIPFDDEQEALDYLASDD